MISPQPMTVLLAKLERLAIFDRADRDAILTLPHTLRALRAREHIVREGDVATHSCVLLSGYAMRHKVAGNGGRQILSVHTAGDLVDLTNAMLAIADHNIETITPVHVAYVPVAAVTALAADRPQIVKALWRDTLVESAIFREWILNIGRRDARSRVAHLICELATRFAAQGAGTREALDWPFTQEQVGDILGLTSVHVNRTLMRLQTERTLDRGSRAIRILDWARLARIGDFEPTYLHLETAVDRPKHPGEQT